MSPRRSQNSPEEIATPTSLGSHTEFDPSQKPRWEIPKELQEKPGPREILVVQLSRRGAVENSKVSRVQAATFQEGRDRMHTIGERHVQIPKAIDEKSKRGSVYNRRFLGGDCRCQPSLNSPEADPIGPTCRFLEN